MIPLTWADATWSDRRGSTWTGDETAALARGYYTHGMSLPGLAELHRRGVNGISAQLNRASLFMAKNSGFPMYNFTSPPTQPSIPRAYADVIHAYADGKVVELKFSSRWEVYNSRLSSYHVGDTRVVWRVQPQKQALPLDKLELEYDATGKVVNAWVLR